jgi:death-on-curing protein
MLEYLSLEDALEQAEFLGLRVRDQGLLHAAIERPCSSAFGVDAYPDLETKAAAMMHSVLKNHALYEGNKRLAWLLFVSFLGINGRRHTMTQDQAFELVLQLATDEIDLAAAAEVIRANLELIETSD